MIWILIVAILILAVPSGYLIAYLCRDELKSSRKWFEGLFILSIVLSIGFFIFGQREISMTFDFIGIVTLISIIKSNDKKWTEKRV
jgi:hypothetical protein